MKAPAQLPAILFSVALLVLCFTIGVLTVSQGPGWCDDGKLDPKCIRDWVNAGGNILAVIVASVAARFAWGQIKIAQATANLARVEPLSLRSVRLFKLLGMANSIRADLDEIMFRAIAWQAAMEDGTETGSLLSSTFHAVDHLYSNVGAAKSRLADLTGEIADDQLLLMYASEVQQLSDVDRLDTTPMPDFGRLLSPSDFNEDKNDLARQRLRDLDYHHSERLNGLGAVIADATKLLQATHAERDRALALDGVATEANT